MLTVTHATGQQALRVVAETACVPYVLLCCHLLTILPFLFRLSSNTRKITHTYVSTAFHFFNFCCVFLHTLQLLPLFSLIAEAAVPSVRTALPPSLLQL